MFFKTYWILWQNARNLKYIKAYNDNIAKTLADSKLKTKDFLSKKWVSVVDTILVIKKHEELEGFELSLLSVPFVIKPNAWYGWKWIIVIDKQDSNWNYISNDNKVYSSKDLLLHFSDILDWFFSLSWNRDRIIIEKKIVLDSKVDLLWKYGLPDIRILVFNMVPVMAMMRIPTENSGWKANLHAWACWAWIDIWSWKITYITQFWKSIKSIAWIWDVRWIKIPDWDKVLKLGVKVQEITKIGYLGCDIVLDEDVWPVLLEMNIRPGLELQVANLAPLEERLKKVWWVSVNSVEKWVRVWKDLFSWDIEHKIENISWKKVLWAREYITLIYNDKDYKYISEIKVSQNLNYIDRNFLVDILKFTDKDLLDSKIILKTKIMWESKTLKFIVKSLETVNIILWINSLKWFLIDPFKYKKWDLPIDIDTTKNIKEKNIAITKWYEEQLIRIDKELMKIDSKLLILKYITPKNLAKEKIKFIKSKWEYIPQFEYNELKIDLEWYLKDISEIEIPEIPLSTIYLKKKDEIINKINYLIAFRDQNEELMETYSKKLYWEIKESNLLYSLDVISDRSRAKKEDEYLTFDEIKSYINKFNHIYSINISLKERDWASRFAMKWDILTVRSWALVWKREMRSIIAHEIEGHYLRKVNWKKSKFSIFSRWTAWYITTEEGIAIYNQNRFLTKEDKKYYSIYERYYFIDYALRNSYEDLINKLIEFYNEDYDKVFTYLSRLKRWFEKVDTNSVFTKDAVYVNWYLEVKAYLENQWKLDDLYIWKINIDDLKYISDIAIFKDKVIEKKTPFFL